MADSAVSALSAVTTVNDTDVVPIVQGGVSMKATVARLNKKVLSATASTQALTAGTTQQTITGSPLTLPVAPTVNTILQWKIIVGKTTAAGTAALVFIVRSGTAGNTSDTGRSTFTFNASTAAIDQWGRLDILCTFTSVGSGTSAVVLSTATMTHSLSTTGLINTPAQSLSVGSGGYDSTATGGLIYSISCAPGTSNTISIAQCVGEAAQV